MKEEIISYFKNDRSYQGGISMYMKYGNRIGFKKQLNVQVESRQMINTLHEELRIVAGINPQEFHSIMSAPVVKPVLEEALDPQPKPAEKKPAEKKSNVQKKEKILKPPVKTIKPKNKK